MTGNLFSEGDVRVFDDGAYGHQRTRETCRGILQSVMAAGLPRDPLLARMGRKAINSLGGDSRPEGFWDETIACEVLTSVTAGGCVWAWHRGRFGLWRATDIGVRTPRQDGEAVEHYIPEPLPGGWERFWPFEEGCVTAAFVNRNRGLRALMSHERHGDDLWLHVSVSCAGRLPNWDELSLARATFLPAGLQTLQIFPPADEYVNDHPHVLHLWCCTSRRMVPDLRRQGTI